MKYEILALLPSGSGRPDVAAMSFVDGPGFTAVFVPAKPGFGLGKVLRRNRLSAAAERQLWLEQLMDTGTVLPFAPGSEIDKSDAASLVAANAETLATLTQELEGCVQYQITVEWSEALVLERFRNAPELSPLFAATSVSAASVASSVARLAKRLGGEFAANLRLISQDFAELPLETGMIFNCVLLIDRDSIEALEAALVEIDTVWTEGFRIRQVGPSPATSFATLRLQHQEADAVERAFQSLELSVSASEAHIHESRQRLLRERASDTARIRSAARLAAAASKLTSRDRGVYLVNRWSEGRAAQLEMGQAV
ncbi:MAG: GvpL/GvpF family gas vesicle protein [Pseudomonadota bacterium]